MTKQKEYHFDAFISYRHLEPDRSCAIWLHKALESYKMPKSMEKLGKYKNVKRVFRDEDELPASSDLSAEIESALENSKFLIVICSPKLAESKWCLAEIKKFQDMGRHDHILTLLVEGEPDQSFPKILREFKDKGQIRNVEPLAADVRPNENQSLREIKAVAKLKILSAIFGCRFDDLRQRDLIRRNHRMKIIAGFMICLTALLSVLTGWALIETNKAKKAEKYARQEKEIAQKERQDAVNALDRLLKNIKALSKNPKTKYLSKTLTKDIDKDIVKIDDVD